MIKAEIDRDKILHLEQDHHCMEHIVDEIYTLIEAIIRFYFIKNDLPPEVKSDIIKKKEKEFLDLIQNKV